MERTEGMRKSRHHKKSCNFVPAPKTLDHDGLSSLPAQGRDHADELCCF